MTAATLTSLPLTAGGALVGSLTRGGVWILAKALDFGLWTSTQFMRAPLAISAIIGVVGFSLLAGSNALYFQSERHPAPLFFEPAPIAAPAPQEAAPVMPAVRPRNLPARIDTETTGSLGVQPSGIIGQAEVLALQQKLVALRFLDDQPDGIFGQRTANAIRAFQKDAGLRVDGKLTPRIITAVGAAGVPAPVPPAPVAESAPLVAALPPAAISQPVPLAPAAPVAPPPVAAAPAIEPPATTNSFAANTLPVTPPLAPVAVAPTPEPVTTPQDLTATGSRVAMNNVPPGARPAPTSGASLSAAQRLAAQIGTLPPEATILGAQRVPVPAAGANDTEGSIDPVLISEIQRGLASLGFLSAKIDGVPGEGTAKAIRNFEVFYDYKITGLATRRLLSLLMQHGAVI